MVFFNQGMLLLGSNFFLINKVPVVEIVDSTIKHKNLYPLNESVGF